MSTLLPVESLTGIKGTWSDKKHPEPSGVWVLAACCKLE